MMKSVFYLLSITISILIFSSSAGQTPLKTGIKLYQSKKIDEANKSFNLIEKSSSDYGVAQYYMGRIAYDKKLFDDAVDYFESATEANPNNGDYFNWLGDSYAAVGSDASFFTQMSVGPKALNAWEKATKLDSKNINARASLVGAYMQAPGFMGGGEDKAKAIGAELLVLLDEAFKTVPDNYLYHYWYGKSSAITGLKLDRGESSLKKYLTHAPVGDEPSHAAAYMRLGQIEERQGKKAEAKKHFEMALELDPKMKSAQEGLERTSK
jgi:tetratricopeptide (TPR) repeat protein